MATLAGLGSTAGDGGAQIATEFINYNRSPNASIFAFMIIFCLLGIAYAGVNRFTIIALIVALSSVITVTAEWFTWTAGLDGKSRSSAVSVFFTYLGYYLGDTVIVLYGYFLVAKLLPEHTQKGDWLMGRKPFMWIFWTMQVGHIISRIAAIIVAVLEHERAPASTRNLAPRVIFDYTLAHFVILTAIELFTAYFLVVIFRRSRKADIRYLGGKRLNLLRHMILSTELRVASMSVLYLFRAAIEKEKEKGSATAWTIDRAVVPFLTQFPILLILDCVLRKALGMELEYQARNERCSCVGSSDNELGLTGHPNCAANNRSASNASDDKDGKLPDITEENASSIS